MFTFQSRLALAIYFEIRKGRGQVGRMLGYLSNSTMGNVDEKVAVLYSHANNVRNWRLAGINADLMVSQISSDMSSIARIRNNMTWEQWRELHRALRILKESMRDNGFNTDEIEDIQNALS
jgi:hypothetical protein